MNVAVCFNFEEHGGKFFNGVCVVKEVERDDRYLMSCLVNGCVLPVCAVEEGSGDGGDLVWRDAALGVFDKNCRSRVLGIRRLGGGTL